MTVAVWELLALLAAFWVGFLYRYWQEQRSQPKVTVLHIHRSHSAEHPLHPEWN